MTNPISDIEDRKTWMDFGKQALWIYQGAKEEGATHGEAMQMTIAFYAGMFRGAKEDPNEEESDTN